MNKTNKYLLIPLSLLSMTVLYVVLLMSSSVNADNDSVVDEINITVPVSCTLSGSGMTSHNASIPNGTYTPDIGTTTLTAFCNDNAGFSIYAIGYTGNEIGATNSTKLVGTSASNNATIDTGTATGPVSGNDTSNWAMKLQTVSSPTPTYPITIDNSFSNYSAVPSSYTKVAHRDNGTDIGTNAEGSTLTTTYAAYISKTQAADTYTGQVKYTMVHPNTADSPVGPLAPTDCPALSICYAPNADDIEGSMASLGSIAVSPTAGKQTNTINESGVISDITANSTVELRAYNYSRLGYGFAGWSPSYEAQVNGSDIIYGPQATISTNPNDPEGADVSTNGLILYPVWVASTGTMQSFSSSDCNSMNIGDVTARTDVRDNNTYAIAKLVDSKCWMVENLRLDNDANITTSNTQSNNGSFGGVFTTLANQENANFSDSINANSLYSTDGSTTNIISGGNDLYWGYRFPRYNNNNINRSLTASYNGTGNSAYYQWYGYGNYYSWPATIADTTHYGTNNQSIENTSLCPTGWRLPKGGNKNNEANNEFWSLVVTGLNNSVNPANYNGKTSPYYTGIAESSPISKALRSYPNNFLYSGIFDGSSARFRSDCGNYWSSSVYDNYLSYNLSIEIVRIIPGSSNSYKNYGQSIRCLAGS